jgi:hypothetical protein
VHTPTLDGLISRAAEGPRQGDKGHDLQPFLTGLIVAHAAFPAVFETYPERQYEGVDGYIAMSDCDEIGNWYVLVRAGQPDALVAVADCAQAEHVAQRAEQGLIADVDVTIWRGGMWPQKAELWRVDDRARWWQRSEAATNG